MSSNSEINIKDIDRAIASFDKSFTIKDLEKALGNSSDTLRRRLERLLDADDRFFGEPGKTFYFRDAYFTGYRFAVTFDEWELGQELLFPGHRLSPYFHSDVFPSDVVLRWNGVEIPKKEISIPLGQIFHYCMLLGSDSVFDFLIAESPANAGLRYSKRAEDQVTLTVYDMKDFYRENNASPGDAVVITVADYFAGIADITFVPGAERSGKARKEWVSALDSALEKVCGRFEDYLDIVDQLVWAMYYGGDALKSPDASIDEFIRFSDKITIRADQDHAVLALRSEINASAESGDDAGQDFFTLSRGETGSLGAILKELGNPVTLPEVEGYILDECFARESDFDAIFRRIFGAVENIGVDEAQQVALYNYLEERFEELHGNYNRADDENKAPLRQDILEGVDAKLEFFRLLADTDADPEALDKDLMHRLAEIDLRLDEMLKLLNTASYTPDQVELERISSMIDQKLDDQQEIIEKLSDQIKAK